MYKNLLVLSQSSLLQKELVLRKSATSPRTIYTAPKVFPKHKIDPTNYERFARLIDTVEEAFKTSSNDLKFFALIRLAESIINELLKAYNIPMTTPNENDNSHKWLCFAEKIDTFMKLSPNPNKCLNELLELSYLYQHVRNPIFHGDLEKFATFENVKSLLRLTLYLLSNFKVTLIKHKTKIAN
ncbi:hypothetical protein [Caryophanon latum]|uniref:Uncharacterized protein n=1 Tax=Caryophanon latum TaxID=33977 RepID=A0A1C0Z1H6_9BACL|nr:hypothetical protein [Caryophanon latum]OCS93206.1 hypothetical protein A6K76_05720 [Caryophanon latum]